MPTVEVVILGKIYKFNTTESPERVKAAASLFEKRTKSITEDFSMISNERTLILAGLNLAEELIRIKSETRLDKVEDFLQGISERIELGMRDDISETTVNVSD